MEGLINTSQGAQFNSAETETECSVNTKTVIDHKSEVCKFFLEGECRFGDQCRNRHEGKPVKKVSPKNKRAQRKQDEERCEEKSKKPPMKTAEDVTKRLQWDPMLPKVSFLNNILFCLTYSQYRNILSSGILIASLVSLRRASQHSAGKILQVLTMMFLPFHNIEYNISSK